MVAESNPVEHSGQAPPNSELLPDGQQPQKRAASTTPQARCRRHVRPVLPSSSSEPILPRKLVIYSDNLHDFTPKPHPSSSTTTTRGSIGTIEMAFRDTLNMALMASTSFRFNPELNLLEIPDPRFPRWTSIQTSHSEVTIEAKLFILTNGYDNNDVPHNYIVRQSLSAMERQLGIRRVDTLTLSFSGIHMCQINRTDESAADFALFLDNMRNIWHQCNMYKKYGRISKGLGVTNFSPWQMDMFMEKMRGEDGEVLMPSLVQIFVKDGEEIPPECVEHAKMHGYEVKAHTDIVDPLDDIMFAEMNRDFLINQRFPTIEVPAEGALVDIMYPRWVIKYSVVNNNSGKFESCGYIGNSTPAMDLFNKFSAEVKAKLPEYTTKAGKTFTLYKQARCPGLLAALCAADRSATPNRQQATEKFGSGAHVTELPQDYLALEKRYLALLRAHQQLVRIAKSYAG
ncbi:hypothetical protein EV182_001058, partial [Spiromyces aspiralis]